MQNAKLDEAQAGIKTVGRHFNNLRYADDTTLMAESEEELKNILMKVKEENEKVGLKFNIQKLNIIASSPITSWQIDEETMKTVRNFSFLGSKITADGDCSQKIKTLALWKKSYDQSRQSIKKQRHYFADKGLYSQSYGFSTSHIWMWELDHKGGWAPKNWSLQTMVLEKTLESSLGSKEIKPVNPRGNQHWIFTGRTDGEAEAPILSPPEANSWLTGKDPDAGKDWQQEEKGTTEDEMVGWHHRLDGHEFEQVPGYDEGQGSLVCCSPCGRKESDMTEGLNNKKNVEKEGNTGESTQSSHRTQNFRHAELTESL